MSRPLVNVLGAAVILLALGLLWQWLAIEQVLTVDNLRGWFASVADWRDNPWLVPGIMAAYAAALLMMFPLTLMVVLTALLFGPTWGFFYATLGTLTSSVVSYWIGRRLGREAVVVYGGRRLQRLSRLFIRRGICTMTWINLLPVAPFTVTNMLAGAFHLRFRDYMIGSTLGIVPGLAAVTLLGSQLGALIFAASREELFWALAGLAAAIGLLLGLRNYGRKLGNRR
ncbi:TVP38/TMEM64 family protein [Thioalkalivibrio sp.]|uniref:TVP38/TMEM64 family protein n=1 Tax=Thioalkalivibrio sp. TaxID=2093813 RepID=UPI0035651F5B